MLRISVGLARRESADRECVYAAAHEGSDRIIDQPMTFDGRAAREARRDDADTKMATLTRARVSDVGRTVVDDLDVGRRKSRFERSPKVPAGIRIALHVRRSQAGSRDGTARTAARPRKRR
jgi:hypothetical protein